MTPFDQLNTETVDVSLYSSNDRQEEISNHTAVPDDRNRSTW